MLKRSSKSSFMPDAFVFPGGVISSADLSQVPELCVPTLRLSVDYLINKNTYISFWTHRYDFIVILEMVGLVLLQRRPQRGHREACHREEHYTVTGIKLHFNNFPKYFYIKI